MEILHFMNRQEKLKAIMEKEHSQIMHVYNGTRFIRQTLLFRCEYRFVLEKIQEFILLGNYIYIKYGDEIFTIIDDRTDEEIVRHSFGKL